MSVLVDYGTSSEDEEEELATKPTNAPPLPIEFGDLYSGECATHG